MSELTDLFRYVKEAFRNEDPNIEVEFGRAEVAKQINQGRHRAGRIVFHEGDPSGDSGVEAPARWLGAEPRPLKDALEKFTIYVWGADCRDIEDASKQHDACWSLFCALRRIVFHKAEGRVSWDSRRWQSPKRCVRRFGTELELVCTIRAQVLDSPLAVVEGVATETTITTAGGDTEIVRTEGSQ